MDDEEYYLNQIPKSKKSRLTPKRIGQAIRKSLTKNGIASIQTYEVLHAQWKAAVGELLAGETQVGKFSRGKLLILVSNSLVLQELHMREVEIVKALAGEESLKGIKGLKLVLGLDR